MTPPPNNNKAAKTGTVEQEIRRRTRISFAVFFVCLTLGVVLFYKLYNQPQQADNVQPLLRKTFNANEKFFSLFFSKKNEAKSFKKSDAVAKVRVNGGVGMDGVLDTAVWRLKIVRKPGDTLLLTMNDLRLLPKTEIVFDFKWNS